MTTAQRVGGKPAPPPETRPRRVPHLPALDGLRALAIAAVVLFHYPIPHGFRGGLFGVGVFFVLSGFLITPTLLADQAGHGRVRLGRFLRRRGWRLLPALVVFLAVLLVVAAISGAGGWYDSNPFGPPHAPGPPESLTAVGGAAAAATGYVYNVFLAFGAPMPRPFGHLWTLSIEGQFYLGWALLLPVLLRRGRRLLLLATLALIAGSAAAPFLVWRSAGAQDWIYFGTVPRIQQFLAGSLMAQLWATGALRRIPRPVVTAAGIISAGVLGYLVMAVGNVTFKYLGALTVVAAASVALLAYLIDDRGAGLGRRLLSARPLVWLGQRSYGVYLWHWPLAVWTNELPHAIGIPLGLAGSLVAAELSWRLVEAPAQRLARRRSEKSRRPVPCSSCGI